VRLCQAQPRSELHIQTGVVSGPLRPACGVVVESETPLTTGGARVRLRLLGVAPIRARPGQFVDVETATGERERVAVVEATPDTLDVEMHEFDPQYVVRVRGPFDNLR